MSCVLKAIVTSLRLRVSTACSRQSLQVTGPSLLPLQNLHRSGAPGRQRGPHAASCSVKRKFYTSISDGSNSPLHVRADYPNRFAGCRVRTHHACPHHFTIEAQTCTVFCYSTAAEGSRTVPCGPTSSAAQAGAIHMLYNTVGPPGHYCVRVTCLCSRLSCCWCWYCCCCHLAPICSWVQARAADTPSMHHAFICVSCGTGVKGLSHDHQWQ